MRKWPCQRIHQRTLATSISTREYEHASAFVLKRREKEKKKPKKVPLLLLLPLLPPSPCFNNKSLFRICYNYLLKLLLLWLQKFVCCFDIIAILTITNCKKKKNNECLDLSGKEDL